WSAPEMRASESVWPGSYTSEPIPDPVPPPVPDPKGPVRSPPETSSMSPAEPAGLRSILRPPPGSEGRLAATGWDTGCSWISLISRGGGRSGSWCGSTMSRCTRESGASFFTATGVRKAACMTGTARNSTGLNTSAARKMTSFTDGRFIRSVPQRRDGNFFHVGDVAGVEHGDGGCHVRLAVRQDDDGAFGIHGHVVFEHAVQGRPACGAFIDMDVALTREAD